MTADKLSVNIVAKILDLSRSEIAVKLMEMGCLPGSKIILSSKAPFGDPLRFHIDNEYSLSLRKSEAAQITVQID